MRIIRHWREVGGNAIVFDIKDSDGSVTIPFEHPLLGKHQIYIHDLPKFIHFVHSQNMHAIARIAIFRDERMVVEHSELAIQSRKNKQPWRENGKLVWTDPSQPKVQEFNIALAKYVAQSGAEQKFNSITSASPPRATRKTPPSSTKPDTPDAGPPETAHEAETCGDGRLSRPAKAKRGGTSTKAGAKEAETTTKAEAPQPTPAVCKATPRGPQYSDVIIGFLKKAHHR